MTEIKYYRDYNLLNPVTGNIEVKIEEFEFDSAEELKQTILASANRAGNDFAYYDRKEDEEHPVGLTDFALKNNWVTWEEIQAAFLKGAQGE